MSDAPTNPEVYEDPLTDHEYDGIREFDNPTPGWWNWLFIGSIIFSIFYFVAYQVGTAGTSVEQAYENQKSEVSKRMLALLGDLPVNEETIIANQKNQDLLAVGAGIFQTNCVSCHGKEAQGLVGPNLTDDKYKNVKTIGDIGEVLVNGANNGAMPAWGNRLPSTEIVAVSVYVASLRGQNLTGVTLDGEVQIAPWPAPPAQPVENAE